MNDYYGTSADFQTYCDDHNYTLPVLTDDDAIIALRVGSEWLDDKYRTAFMAPVSNSRLLSYRGATGIGTYKTGGRAQIREWPRAGFVDAYGYVIPFDEIPREIIQATYEATFRQVTAPGSLMVDNVRSKYQSVRIEGAVSVTYASDLSASELQPEFLIIDRILAGLLDSTANAMLSNVGGRVERA